MTEKSSKRAIRAALLELLLDKPLDKVTVTEVVARAGVSRVTYYRSFYSLHEVVGEALDELFSQVEDIVGTRPAPRAHAGRMASELAIYRVLMLYRDNVALLQPLLLGSLSAEAVERMYGFILKLTPMPAVDDAASPDSRDRVSAMMRTYVAGGMATVVIDWLRGGCVEPAEDVLAFITAASRQQIGER